MPDPQSPFQSARCNSRSNVRLHKHEALHALGRPDPKPPTTLGLEHPGTRFGPNGNAQCWDGVYNYDRTELSREKTTAAWGSGSGDWNVTWYMAVHGRDEM